MQGYEALVVVDLIHEYRAQGLKKLDQTRKECEGLVGDRARVFGELHFIPTHPHTTLEICWMNWENFQIKVLRMQIREQMKKQAELISQITSNQ